MNCYAIGDHNMIKFSRTVFNGVEIIKSMFQNISKYQVTRLLGLSLSVQRNGEQDRNMMDLTANLTTNCAYILCFMQERNTSYTIVTMLIYMTRYMELKKQKFITWVGGQTNQSTCKKYMQVRLSYDPQKTHRFIHAM